MVDFGPYRYNLANRRSDPPRRHIRFHALVGHYMPQNENKLSGEADFGQEEIARRRDDAICRALSTPPKPIKELVGKSERAQSKRKSRVRNLLDQSQNRSDFGDPALKPLAIYEVLDRSTFCQPRP